MAFRRGSLAFFPAVVTTLGVVVLLQLSVLAWIKGVTPSALNQDVAWMLYGGQVLLEGGEYGVDIVDPNPPLIFWLSALVVALAQLVSITPQLAYDLTVIVLVFASVALCHAIYTRRASPTPEAWLITALFAIAMVVPAGRDFGQRDHLTAVLVMPYLLLLGTRLENLDSSRQLLLGAGLLAGVGIALKPFFLLMWLVPEAYVVMRHGWRESCCRIENVSILATQVVYLGVVVVFAPAYLEVATGLFGYQDAYASPIPLLNQATKYLLLAVGLTLVFRPSGGNGSACGASYC